MKSISNLDNMMKNSLNDLMIKMRMNFDAHDDVPASVADIKTLSRLTYDTLDEFRQAIVAYLKG